MATESRLKPLAVKNAKPGWHPDVSYVKDSQETQPGCEAIHLTQTARRLVPVPDAVRCYRRVYHPNRCHPCQTDQPLSNGRVVKTLVEAAGTVCHAAVAGRPSGYAGKAKSLRPSLPPARLAGATIGA